MPGGYFIVPGKIYAYIVFIVYYNTIFHIVTLDLFPIGA